MSVIQQREQHPVLDANRSPNARPEPEGATLLFPEQVRRPMTREVTPDLRRNCPVCGNAYQPGEGVLALACLPFATRAFPCLSTPIECDLTDKIVLGHHECVLPRLLTLLAGFRPEARFETASTDLFAGESVLSEGDDDRD
jgi:hypothetical protein